MFSTTTARDPLMQAAVEHHFQQHRPTLERTETPPPDYDSSPTASQRDRLFQTWYENHYSPRQTQIMEDYKDFRMGQGDPLLKEIFDQHRRKMMDRISVTPFNDEPDDDGVDKEPPAGTSYMSDIVYIDGERTRVPVLPTKGWQIERD